MTTATIDRSVDLNCSKHDAYEKLSRFDFYAQFPGVTDVQPRGGNQAHLVVDMEGRHEEFDLALDQEPEERIELHALGGPSWDSSFRLQPLDENHTRLQVHVEYDPQQLRQRYQVNEQDVERRVQDRLQTIKSYAERPGA